MFIRLTRLDSTPIWINASFVVTVEPRKGGGSVVVPIGDGLDYDVKETPESVLALLGDAPAPAVVPVPAPPMLAPTAPADVSPEPEPSRPDAPPTETGTAHVRKTARSRARSKPAATAAETADGESDDKPAEPAAKRPRASRKAKKLALDLSEDQVARLKKMAPGSVRKLQNTLATQFAVADAAGVVAALEAHEVLSIDRDHIIWK